MNCQCMIASPLNLQLWTREDNIVPHKMDPALLLLLSFKFFNPNGIDIFIHLFETTYIVAAYIPNTNTYGMVTRANTGNL